MYVCCKKRKKTKAEEGKRRGEEGHGVELRNLRKAQVLYVPDVRQSANARVNEVNDTGEIDRVTLGAQTRDRGDSEITTFTPRRKQRNGHSRRESP